MNQHNVCPQNAGKLTFDTASQRQAHMKHRNVGFAALALAVTPTLLCAGSLFGDCSDIGGLPSSGWALVISVIGVFTAPFAWIPLLLLYARHKQLRHRIGFLALSCVVVFVVNLLFFYATAISCYAFKY